MERNKKPNQKGFKKKQYKQLYEHDILNRKIQNNNRTTKVRGKQKVPPSATSFKI